MLLQRKELNKAHANERMNQQTLDDGYNDNDKSSKQDSGMIVLTCLGFSTKPLKRFLNDCRFAALISRSSMTTFHTPGFYTAGFPNLYKWSKGIVRPSRPIDTIDIEQEKKQALIDDIYDYLRPVSRRYYARRGIPYRRGYLFYGPPGTGKTSMSLALAGLFGLELFILNIGSHKGGSRTLESLFAKLPSKCVVLLEDIDSAGLKREKMRSQAPSRGDDDDTITLSDVLNIIDGISSREGRIIIMTTNHPETLDPALIRPGRIDMQVFFGPLSAESAALVFMRMYSRDANEYNDGEEIVNIATHNHQLGAHATSGKLPILLDDKEQLQKLAERFAREIPPDRFTAAEVQNFLLMKGKDPAPALADVGVWVANELQRKEQHRQLALGMEASGAPNEVWEDQTEELRKSRKKKTKQYTTNNPQKLQDMFFESGKPQFSVGPSVANKRARFEMPRLYTSQQDGPPRDGPPRTPYPSSGRPVSITIPEDAPVERPGPFSPLTVNTRAANAFEALNGTGNEELEAAKTPFGYRRITDTTPSSAIFPSDAQGSRRLSTYFLYRPKGAEVSPEELRRQQRTSEFFKGTEKVPGYF